MLEKNFPYYKQPNRRKCYWMLKECLKGKSPCSYACPGYLSVAQADRQRKTKDQGGCYGQDICRG